MLNSYRVDVYNTGHRFHQQSRRCLESSGKVASPSLKTHHGNILLKFSKLRAWASIFWRPANFVWFYYKDAEPINAASPLCPNSDLRGLVFFCQAQIWRKKQLTDDTDVSWMSVYTRKNLMLTESIKNFVSFCFVSHLLAAHVVWQLAFLTFVLSSVMLGTQAIKAKQNNWVPPKK